MAISLLLPWTGSWARWAAVALLAGFSAFLLVLIARRSDAPCNCFGSRHANQPASWRSVARNLLLMGVAVLLTQIPAEAPARALARAVTSSPAGTALAALAVLTSALAAVLVTVLARYGRALARITHLESITGEDTQAATGQAPAGHRGLAAGSSVPGDLRGWLNGGSGQAAPGAHLYVALSPGCAPCMLVIERLRALGQAAGQPQPVTAVLTGPAEQSSGLAAELAAGRIQVRCDEHGVLAAGCGLPGTPAAVLIEEGSVAEPAALGAAEVIEAINRRVAPLAPDELAAAVSNDGLDVPRPRNGFAALRRIGDHHGVD